MIFDGERDMCYDAYLLVITKRQERGTTRQVTLSYRSSVFIESTEPFVSLS